ncbi:MAG: hypothetical protein HYY95_01830 [Candidatus Rokubacteria bacterium]|nr:hypothetical protein [Candidatus Rokubacteria bacterium]MBI3104324.1 hypothetical protein [Candidatus Rokubacteria bacterium]
MPTLPDASVPPGEQAGGGCADAPADGIGIGENLRQLVAMSRQEVGVPLLDVTFSLFAQLDAALEPRAREAAGHSAEPADSDAPGAASVSRLIRRVWA